jgi:outer membrane lipoprotein-sorting protein
MRRRTLFILIAVLALAAILIVGVVAAGAKSTSNLPAISAQQLLQNVATNAHKTTAVNGEFAWSNDLLGTSSLLSLGGNQTPSGLASLLQGGSGRVWLQDGKARIESQGQNGDFIAVVYGTTAWTWDSMTNTATQYALPTPAAGSTAEPLPSPTASIDPATAIADIIQKLAPTATLSVSGQEVVANQDAYVLKMTPVSPITTFGSVEVAIDGHRWVPLRVQVFAKGGSSAALSAGFKSVSYQPAADSLFAFTPPSGATVVHKDLSKSLQGIRQGTQTEPKAAQQHRPLTLAQAKTAAPFLLTPSSTPTGLEFKGAFVTPTAPAGSGATATKHPPVAVLGYGTGFGSVWVVETPASAQQDKQIEQQLGQLSMIGKTTVNGMSATKLQASLGSAVTFTQGGVRVVVVGLVPFNDITQIAGSLK